MKLKNKDTALPASKTTRSILAVLLVLFISISIGCGTSSSRKQSSRYKQKHDKYPTKVPKNLSRIKNATPKIEPRSRQGNAKTYVVRKKRYYVMKSSSGYKQRGIASFYGTKFHGHLTSNGETYNMYAMTAAHKSLPIPTYVEVKNLNNGKKIIVRVNDRGPFHNGRIIDLSYAAASKIGMLGAGTAKVEVKAIDVRRWLAKNKRGYRGSSQVAQVEKITPSSINTGSKTLRLQMGAFSNKNNAVALVRKIKDKIKHPVKIHVVSRNAGKIYKVTIGPFTKSVNIAAIKSQLIAANLPHPVIVR